MNNLAPELVYTICEGLSLQDLKGLRLTCKHLAEHLAPHVLHTIRFNVSAGTIERDMPRFRSLVNSDTSAVKHLQLGSLAPEHDATFKKTWKVVDGRSVCDEAPPPTPQQVAADEELQRILGNAFGALKAVQRVAWSPSSEDPPYAISTIVKTITAYPELSVLDLNLCNTAAPIDISHLRNLQALRVDMINKSHLDVVYDGVARAIANSPSLTLLSIGNTVGFQQPPDPTQSLHQLFKCYPADAPPLKLHALILNQTAMRVDDVTLSHLRHLKHFDFTRTDIREEVNRYNWDDVDAYVSSFSAQGARIIEFGQTDADVWDSLRAADIQLESIRHDHYSPSFLRFLSSQTGLKVLHFSPYGFDNGASSDAAAATFFHDSPDSAWSNISQTIEILTINPSFEGEWCFGGRIFSEEKLGMAKHLKSVNLCVISSQLANDMTPKDFKTHERVFNRETRGFDMVPLADGLVSDAKALLRTSLPENDCIKRLIDVCMTSIHPKTVGISHANLERNRGFQMGAFYIVDNLAMTHLTSCTARSSISLRRYRTPPGILRDAEHILPILESNKARDLWDAIISEMFPAGFGGRAEHGYWTSKYGRRKPGTWANEASSGRAKTPAEMKRIVYGYQRCPSVRYPVWDHEKERFGYSLMADEEVEEMRDVEDGTI